MVQAFGKIKTDLTDKNIDAASFSSHKIHGPKGIGGLFLRRGLRIEPLMYGGHQEREIRPGTENVLFSAAFAAAAEEAAEGLEAYRKTTGYLRNKLLEGISGLRGAVVNTPVDSSVTNTLNVSFSGIEGEALLIMLDMEGIAVSTGSACSSGVSGPSHVLEAQGRDPVVSRGSIRFSMSRYTTEEEIDYTVAIVRKAVEKLGGMSPI